jgi:hypothetical protein
LRQGAGWEQAPLGLGKRSFTTNGAKDAGSWARSAIFVLLFFFVSFAPFVVK